ncbi:hypothetical protein AB0N05_34785 [Nocardia sp. NPDC051030]|uniref:hypothetical protein n=1 Tax=Nocardia sp. NPDC051030 TaxID=3155162 RepID=UPI00342BBC1D
MIMAIALTLAPVTLMTIRLVKIKRHGIGGGEFNHPFATAGYGGVLPGSVMQEDFGDTTTSHTEIVAAQELVAAQQRKRRVNVPLTTKKSGTTPSETEDTEK